MNSAAVAALIAVNPAGLGGVALRSRASAERDAWLKLLRSLLPAHLPMRRIPLHVDDSRLLGGLDLAASLGAGRPVVQAGVLAQSDSGLAVLASAERLSAGAAARFAHVLDCGEVLMERNGLSLRSSARLGLIALDEGASDDEQLPAALLDRLAFHLAFDEEMAQEQDGDPDAGALDAAANAPLEGWGTAAVHAARQLLARVTASDDCIQALCAGALALGISSPRAPWLALQAARAAAALDGRMQVDDDDTRLAAQLVLAPRATRLPEAPAEEPAQEVAPDNSAQAQDAADASEEPAPAPPSPPANDSQPDASAPDQQELEDQVLQAAKAAIPVGLLAALRGAGRASTTPSPSRGAGAQHNNTVRGRPAGTRRGSPAAGAQLNIMETLRAAAPWQGLRRREMARSEKRHPGTEQGTPCKILVRREDFHVSRFRQQRQTTTIFVVDASGSSALHRLAEAKGAVELLLADCYVRRDRVAVLAFRGKTCELLLPPTRSLVRAKRSLAVLPGGGSTPLAAGLDMAREMAQACERRGETPVVVLLTDARANVARDGSPGREGAVRDAMASARTLRASALSVLLLDTSPRAEPGAQRLAEAMGARYLPLPHAGADVLVQAVRGASAAPAVLR